MMKLQERVLVNQALVQDDGRASFGPVAERAEAAAIIYGEVVAGVLDAGGSFHRNEGDGAEKDAQEEHIHVFLGERAARVSLLIPLELRFGWLG